MFFHAMKGVAPSLHPETPRRLGNDFEATRDRIDGAQIVAESHEVEPLGKIVSQVDVICDVAQGETSQTQKA